MNLLPATVSGAIALIGETEITLDRSYDASSGTIEIGVRPEHTHISDDGLPVQVERVDRIRRRVDFDLVTEHRLRAAGRARGERGSQGRRRKRVKKVKRR